MRRQKRVCQKRTKFFFTLFPKKVKCRLRFFWNFLGNLPVLHCVCVHFAEFFLWIKERFIFCVASKNRFQRARPNNFLNGPHTLLKIFPRKPGVDISLYVFFRTREDHSLQARRHKSHFKKWNEKSLNDSPEATLETSHARPRKAKKIKELTTELRWWPPDSPLIM